MLNSIKLRPIFHVAAIAAFLFFISGIGLGQVVTAKGSTGVEDVYLAKDDGTGHAGDVVTSFQTGDVPIYCVVVLESQTVATVKMNFVAVSVPGVKAETRVVSSTYTTKVGEDRVNFTGRPRDAWTAGTYRVDVFVDGKLAKNVEFEIRGSAKAVPASGFVQSAPLRSKPPRRQKKN